MSNTCSEIYQEPRVSIYCLNLVRLFTGKHLIPQEEVLKQELSKAIELGLLEESSFVPISQAIVTACYVYYRIQKEGIVKELEQRVDNNNLKLYGEHPFSYWYYQTDLEGYLLDNDYGFLFRRLKQIREKKGDDGVIQFCCERLPLYKDLLSLVPTEEESSNTIIWTGCSPIERSDAEEIEACIDLIERAIWFYDRMNMKYNQRHIPLTDILRDFHKLQIIQREIQIAINKGYIEYAKSAKDIHSGLLKPRIKLDNSSYPSLRCFIYFIGYSLRLSIDDRYPAKEVYALFDTGATSAETIGSYWRGMKGVNTDDFELFARKLLMQEL